MNKIHTIEDEDFVPYGFFIEEKDRDDAFIKYVVKMDRWGIRGER